jgi:flagellar protein FlaG
MIAPTAPFEARQAAAYSRAGAGSNSIVDVRAAAVTHPANDAAMREAVAAINRAASTLNNSVQLSLDTDSGQTLVRVVDSETGQLIRQIPSEEVLSLRDALDRITGLLIDRTA